MGCMQEIGDRRFCPECGFDNAEKQQAPFLPYRTVLANRYIVGAGIDTNGESTRYLCYDKQTGDIAIVAEFLPVGLFSRAEGETEVRVNYENRLVYNKLKDDFINYYRVVADLRELSALMNVHNIFEENNTAYVIEDSEDYIPFEEYVERSGGSLDWDVARPLFMPVISARKRGTSLKSQLFSGAAAPEQYEVAFPLDDITDIYGLCATLFYALTGHLPKAAPERLKDSRLLMSTTTVKKLPPHVVSALANGLQVERENRITDFDELRSQLAHTAKAIQDEISRTASMNISRSDKEQKNRNGMSRVSIVIIAAAATFVILGIAGVFWLMSNPLKGLFGGNQNATQESTMSTEWTGPTVPNYVGMSYEEAVKAAGGSTGVTLMRAYSDEHSDSYKEGVVMAQSPAAGSKVSQDGNIVVSVTVSKGAQMRFRPISRRRVCSRPRSTPTATSTPRAELSATKIIRWAILSSTAPISPSS